ncbi:MAG: type II toxin-antitoxin system VapC family toxin [Alphaproteobacteria bacterium]|nr:type II toxin-antitoxin system VapC family toxin [Alphaproteobacteria bacterium]
MTACVIDASVAACWCFHDEDDARADVAYELLRDGRAIVPLHWWFELRNVLLIGERRRRVSQREIEQYLDRLSKLAIDIVELPASEAVFLNARKHGLTFYDAAYLELAMRERVPLATLDDDLVSAARQERVPLISAP